MSFSKLPTLMKMQSPPPENARIITPGTIPATRHAITKFVKKRAEALCKGRTGWWGERAVEAAIWAYLEKVIATVTDDVLEEATGSYMIPEDDDLKSETCVLYKKAHEAKRRKDRG